MTRTGAEGPVVSPCTGVCALDRFGRHCLGCGRTLDEIAEWASANEARRRQIIARLTEMAARRVD